MKKQNVRQNVRQAARTENKSVSSKVTIHNSTTLIERSETGQKSRNKRSVITRRLF